MFASLIESLRYELGEGLASSMKKKEAKAKAKAKSQGKESGDGDDDDEREAEQRADFNRDWQAAKERKAERSHEMRQRFSAQQRQKTMSTALKAIAGAAKSAASAGKKK